MTVEGGHEAVKETRNAKGYVSNHFIRRYQLPANVDVSNVVSNLSNDGVLTIQAPKMALSIGKLISAYDFSCSLANILSLSFSRRAPAATGDHFGWPRTATESEPIAAKEEDSVKSYTKTHTRITPMNS